MGVSMFSRFVIPGEARNLLLTEHKGKFLGLRPRNGIC